MSGAGSTDGARRGNASRPRHAWLLLGWWSLLAWPQTPPPTPDPALDARRAAQLDQLKQQITTLKATLQGQSLAQDATRRRLREIDLKIAESARALIELNQEIAVVEARLRELEVERTRLESKLTGERSQLARLLRSAYAVGQLAQVKLALSQDRVGRIGRVLTYHGYLNRSRIAAIAVLRESLLKLAQVRAEVAATRSQLDLLVADERQRTEGLAGERAERETFLDTLGRDITTSNARLLALEEDRQALEALLSQLGDVLADLPDAFARQTFATLRGRLPWPLIGTVVRRFGEAGEDGRPASALSIAGAVGGEVRAVSYGRIAFSDWLRGFGMLTIVDHGDGWMSLYGHCETLLKSEGDWVQAGEVLATVGSSGGQADRQPALYFELRQKGTPVDPDGWLAKP